MKIKAVEFKTRPVKRHSHFHPKTKSFTPIKLAAGQSLYEVLDDIALAVESGTIDTETWLAQLFANSQSFKNFVNEIESLDPRYPITDRWWLAVASLVGREESQEGFSTCEDIADGLFNVVRIDGQLGKMLGLEKSDLDVH